MTDIIDHPTHYEASRVQIEPIDLCECYSFCIGNAIKYMLRAGKKEGNSEAQDLAKARWYLKRELVHGQDTYLHNETVNHIKVRAAIFALAGNNHYLCGLFNLSSALPEVIREDGLTECICRISRRLIDIEEQTHDYQPQGQIRS